MGTHASANGKAASKTRHANGDATPTPKEDASLLDAQVKALELELSRFVDANAKLGEENARLKAGAEDRKKSDLDAIVARGTKRTKHLTSLRVNLIAQKREWSNSLVHDTDAVIEYAALSGETEIGELAIELRELAVLLGKRCDAQLSAHAFDEASK